LKRQEDGTNNLARRERRKRKRVDIMYN